MKAEEKAMSVWMFQKILSTLFKRSATSSPLSALPSSDCPASGRACHPDRRSVSPFRFVGLCFAFLAAARAGASIEPGRLTCEYREDPPVIDARRPRLSWINRADPGERGQRQTAYQIQVASSEALLLSGRPDLWDSRKVRGEESSLVHYAGAPLKSRQDCWWRVRVWDKDGKPSGWSRPGRWGMGLLDPADWKAKWIGAPWQGDTATAKTADKKEYPAPLLRKEFSVDKEVASAKIFITGLGYFELYLNGGKVGDDLLVPNQTNYDKRDGLRNYRVKLRSNDPFKGYNVLYLCYDLTGHIRRGKNALGCMLGNGFYNAPIYWTMPYGSPRMIAQLHIVYADGTEEMVVSDSTWKAAPGPIVSDGIYSGETYDARLERPGWCSPGMDETGWEPAALRRAPAGTLQAQMAHSDKVMERLRPLKIKKLEEGKYMVDFGEEISGRVRLMNMRGEAGRKIHIRDVPPRSGKNVYIMRGGGPESYAAHFSWFVFSRVEISGFPGELTGDNIVAEAVYTEMEQTGRFECSNKLFNRINKIWTRSLTDNAHGSILSDCPHRERSAYTGDGQVSCVTVMHNYDTAALYTKWMRDIRLAQDRETGYVPNAAPWQPGCAGGVPWGAAMNIIPWEFYLHYGDRDMLADNYQGMKEQTDYMLNWVDSEGVMFQPGVLGDWCPPERIYPSNALVHTFYLWRCADFTAKAAAVLGRGDDAARYAALARRTKDAFHKRFYDPAKRTYGVSGSNIFALRMGVPKEREQDVLDTVRKDLRLHNGHLDTGIFATQFFFETLADYGLNDLAYEAMDKKDYPSYGCWISQGATTTWERWDGRQSHNHPMFGGGLVWFYRRLAGVETDPARPGYRHAVIKPHPAGGMTYASYATRTPYGELSARWDRTDAGYRLAVTVPVSCSATVHIPAKPGCAVTEGGKDVRQVKGIVWEGIKDGYAAVRVPSGTYRFEARGTGGGSRITDEREGKPPHNAREPRRDTTARE